MQNYANPMKTTSPGVKTTGQGGIAVMEGLWAMEGPWTWAAGSG